LATQVLLLASAEPVVLRASVDLPVVRVVLAQLRVLELLVQTARRPPSWESSEHMAVAVAALDTWD
jgi:hypothetical protein